MSKKKDITKEKDVDLQKQLTTLRDDLRQSNFALGAQDKDTKARRGVRRQIARILTQMNQRARQTV